MPPTRTSSKPARRWPLLTALCLTLMLPLSTTGCSRPYVIIDGEATVTVKKSTLDQLYSDNERLLQALDECQSRRERP